MVAVPGPTKYFPNYWPMPKEYIHKALQEEIREFTRKVDSLVIGARSVSEMYRKLNTLQTQGLGGWQTLRCPVWVGDTLVAIVLRPARK